MQCLVLVGLGDGLGSGDDEDGCGLGDDPVGVLVTAVGVDSLGAGVAVRVGASCCCR
jgi:hypothetical protein